MSKPKSRLEDVRNIELAAEMIRLGARTQVICYEIPAISVDKAISLCKEITGEGPAKGSLPFSTEWFLEFVPNIHSSLFLGIYRNCEKSSDHFSRAELLIAAYRLYIEWTKSAEIEADLSFTRAWMLVRNVTSGSLKAKKCETCSGHFIVDGFHHGKLETCNLCSIKQRTGPLACLNTNSEEGQFQDAWDN